MTITNTARDLREKKYSSVELVKTYLEKIKKLDVKVKSYLTLCENEALVKAKQADSLLKKGSGSLLLGIPLAVKDNFCVEGIKTTASSLVLENYLPQYSATVIVKLNNSGAIILGKTNMDAWAHGSSTETSQFFTTKNPWDLTCLPGGSSGGSAAAVAAGFCAGAIGSETAGSIRQPASWCGVVGFKPGYGLVSRWGLISMGSSLDCPGPLSKTVQDAKIIFDVIKGKDMLDATSIDAEKQDAVLKKNKIKIGLPREYFSDSIQEEVKKLVMEAVGVLKSEGIAIEDISLLDPKYSIADYTIIQRAEVSSNMGRYDGIRYGNDRKHFGEEAKRRIMLGTYVLSAGYQDEFYIKAQQVRTLICRDFDKAFEKVDLIIAPTTPCTALPVGSTKGAAMFGELQDVLVEASSMAGLPGLNIPCGFSEKGLPVSLQLIGPRFSEELLFEVGNIYESLTDWHKRKPNL